MVKQGGLLTEFFTNTNADKMNFVRRNRIVAGMSDATILVESAAKGGGLITAGIAQSYDRDVFAFPGRPSDPYSEGCNNLIRDNGLDWLIMPSIFPERCTGGWCRTSQSSERGYPEVSSPICLQTRRQSSTCYRNRTTCKSIWLPYRPICQSTRSQPLLFQLEIKGVIKTLAGGIYHLMY